MKKEFTENMADEIMEIIGTERLIVFAFHEEGFDDGVKGVKVTGAVTGVSPMQLTLAIKELEGTREKIRKMEKEKGIESDEDVSVRKVDEEEYLSKKTKPARKNSGNIKGGGGAYTI